MSQTTSAGTRPVCPACQGTDFRHLNWRHPMMFWVMLFWRLVPLIAINELLLGQRWPKALMECRSCEEPYPLRVYVRCEQCGTMHADIIWSGRNLFGHWFGLVCPSCGSRIPSTLNLSTLAVVMVTAPLWYLPYRLLRRRWVEWEKQRAAQATARVHALSTIGTSRRQCVQRGAFLGVVISVVTATPIMIVPFFTGGRLGWATTVSLLLYAVLCGALLGYVWFRNYLSHVKQ